MWLVRPSTLSFHSFYFLHHGAALFLHTTDHPPRSSLDQSRVVLLSPAYGHRPSGRNDNRVMWLTTQYKNWCFFSTAQNERENKYSGVFFMDRTRPPNIYLLIHSEWSRRNINFRIGLFFHTTLTSSRRGSGGPCIGVEWDMLLSQIAFGVKLLDAYPRGAAPYWLGCLGVRASVN